MRFSAEGKKIFQRVRALHEAAHRAGSRRSPIEGKRIIIRGNAAYGEDGDADGPDYIFQHRKTARLKTFLAVGLKDVTESYVSAAERFSEPGIIRRVAGCTENFIVSRIDLSRPGELFQTPKGQVQASADALRM